MKKNYVLLLVFGISVIASLFFFFKTSHEKKWNTFVDARNGWEIRYPADITTVEAADDIGPVNWLHNLVFKNNEDWVFSITAVATTTPNTEGFVDMPSENEKEKSFILVKSHKAFFIHTNTGSPTEEILESLVVED